MTVAQNVAFAGGGGRRAAEPPAHRRTWPTSARVRCRAASVSGWHSRARSRATRRVLLLDEPLAALDAHTRLLVRDELGEILDQLGDPDADRHPRLRRRREPRRPGRGDRRGQLRQVGTPAELVAEPGRWVRHLVHRRQPPRGNGRRPRGAAGRRRPRSALQRAPRGASRSASTRGTCALRPIRRATASTQSKARSSSHASQGGRARLRIGRLVVECSDADAARARRPPGRPTRRSRPRRSTSCRATERWLAEEPVVARHRIVRRGRPLLLEHHRRRDVT